MHKSVLTDLPRLFFTADGYIVLQAGEPYPATWRVFGKPNAEPYRLAAAILDSQAEALGWKSASASPSVRPYNIFMIGGTPLLEVSIF